MNERIISQTPTTKTVIKEDVGDTIIETTEKVDTILNKNKEEANDFRKGDLLNNTQKHQRKIAEIPMTLYFNLIKKLGRPKENPKAWKKYLNDPHNRYLRTDTGKL